MILACPPTPAVPHACKPPGAEPALRRRLVQRAGSVLLATLLPPPARAALAVAGSGQRPRQLWVTRPQAQEAVRAVYWADGALQPEGYAALKRLYRDLHANEQHPIALGLLDLNFLMQSALALAGPPRPLVLFSGYRTRRTNALVGGTEPNIHAQGIADDFRFAGLSLLENYRLARRFQVGGLGLYPDRGSLHKDLGRFRSWVTAGRRTDSHHEHASFG